MVSLENSLDRLEESVVVLKHRYFPNFDLFAAKTNPHFSCAWLSMLETHDLIVAGSRWSVGSGLLVRILDDRWLLSPTTFRIMNSFVRWRGGTTSEAENILAVPIQAPHTEDRLVCHYNTRVLFSVLSAYRLAMMLDNELGEVSSEIPD
ncbi:UNVERIFIED_CONTAM: hypothetical protein Sangu_2138400 [Sesamum angustifolium]|uniref:Uncharacterized protein n=1 Tax=Sesamum angustifolium TaxID=2727405 RepID=A0AAW2LGC9_9LAMI